MIEAFITWMNKLTLRGLYEEDFWWILIAGAKPDVLDQLIVVSGLVAVFVQPVFSKGG